MAFQDLIARADQFSLAQFGTPAILHQPGLPDTPLQVIFDLNSMAEMGVLNDRPQITIQDSDLVGIDLKYATITVTGKYPESRMLKPMPDGSGLTILLLTRV